MSLNELSPESRQQKLLALWRQMGELLWEWNPVGFPVPSDEYDSLITPLIHQIEKGVPSQIIAEFLEQSLQDKFGLTPPFEKPAIDFVEKVKRL